MPRTAAALPLCLVACAAAPGGPAGADELRVAVALGPVQADGARDADPGNPPGSEAGLAADQGLGGFLDLEVGGGGALALHLRTVACRSEHDLSSGAATADLTQGALLAMLGIPCLDTAAVRLTPLLGVGAGYANLDYDGVFAPPDASGAGVAFALGAEAQLGGHLLIGAMGWGLRFGEPGDTEGEAAAVLVYGGWRF